MFRHPGFYGHLPVHAQFSADTVPYRTYLQYAGGLEPGASVLFGGIDVGKVTAVRPWASDPTKIEILLEVKQGTPLNEKSVAKLGLVSIMNSAALSITTGSNEAKRLPPGPRSLRRRLRAWTRLRARWRTSPTTLTPSSRRRREKSKESPEMLAVCSPT